MKRLHLLDGGGGSWGLVQSARTHLDGWVNAWRRWGRNQGNGFSDGTQSPQEQGAGGSPGVPTGVPNRLRTLWMWNRSVFTQHVMEDFRVPEGVAHVSSKGVSWRSLIYFLWEVMCLYGQNSEERQEGVLKTCSTETQAGIKPGLQGALTTR